MKRYNSAAPLTSTVLACLGLLTIPAHAGLVYQTAIDTHSLASTPGYLELQFSAGTPAPPDVTATVSLFNTDAVAGSATPTSTVGSLLPGPSLAFDNLSGGDYLQAFTFGNFMNFTVTLSGPGVDGPNITAGGSSFAVYLFDSGFNPLLTNDAVFGELVELDLNNNGSVTPVNNSAQTVVTAQSATPEPATSLLGGFALAAIFVSRRRTCFRVSEWLGPDRMNLCLYR